MCNFNLFLCPFEINIFLKGSFQFCNSGLSFTFCSLMDCWPPASSVHGISHVRILRCITISFCKGSSQPRNWTTIFGRCVLYPLSLQGSLRKTEEPEALQSMESQRVGHNLATEQKQHPLFFLKDLRAIPSKVVKEEAVPVWQSLQEGRRLTPA